MCVVCHPLRSYHPMIFYHTPHLGIAGGIKTLATHVLLLRAQGMDAWLVNCGGTHEPWCRPLEDVQPFIISWSEFNDHHNSKAAINVVPETHPQLFPRLRGARILILLNWLYAEVFLGCRYAAIRRRWPFIEPDKESSCPPSLRLPKQNVYSRFLRTLRVRKNLQRLGVTAVFTNAAYCRDWIRKRTSHEVFVIPTGIDKNIFYESKEQRQPHRILTIATKNLSEIEKTKSELAHTPYIEFVLAKDMHETEMARQYRKADLFLTFGKYEGLPRTVLEAMHSGCVVIGYDGRGGKEIMLHRKTALVARSQEDMLRYTKELVSNPILKELIRRGGKAISSRYTLATQSQKLLEALQAVFRMVAPQV